MLWFGKRTASSAVATVPAEVVPVDLPVPLDPEIFQRHFNALLAGMEQDGGADSFLAALEAKAAGGDATLRGRAHQDSLGMDAIENVLALVFTARRKLYPALTALGDDASWPR